MRSTAIVTGGIRGIGAAISIALKEAGHAVEACYAGNDAAAQKFKATTGIDVYKFDVSDFQASQEAVVNIESDLGPAEALVNNAGITQDGIMHKMSFEQWNLVIQLQSYREFMSANNEVVGIHASSNIGFKK